MMYGTIRDKQDNCNFTFLRSIMSLTNDVNVMLLKMKLEQKYLDCNIPTTDRYQMSSGQRSK